MEQQELVNAFNTLHLPGNIRHLRKTLSLSQEDFSKKVGLNRGNIASYENGTAEPKICSLLKIADLFKVAMIDLVLRDLTEPTNYNMAMTAFQRQSTRDKQVLDKQHVIAEEIEKVIESLHHCHAFKVKEIDENGPRELKAMAHSFEELYHVSKQLLKNHQKLLNFVHCRLEHRGNC